MNKVLLMLLLSIVPAFIYTGEPLALGKEVADIKAAEAVVPVPATEPSPALAPVAVPLPEAVDQAKVSAPAAETKPVAVAMPEEGPAAMPEPLAPVVTPEPVAPAPEVAQ